MPQHTARKCRAQRHSANRYALRVSGSVSYALLFLFEEVMGRRLPCLLLVSHKSATPLTVLNISWTFFVGDYNLRRVCLFVCWLVRWFVNILPTAALADRRVVGRRATGMRAFDQHRSGAAGSWRRFARHCALRMLFSSCGIFLGSLASKFPMSREQVTAKPYTARTDGRPVLNHGSQRGAGHHKYVCLIIVGQSR